MLFVTENVRGKIFEHNFVPNGGYLLLVVLLYRHECFTEKYTTREIHTKPHLGLEWRIFHILAGEDINDFTDIKLIS